MSDREPTGSQRLAATWDSSPPPKVERRITRIETYLSVAIACLSLAIAVGSWAYTTLADTRDQSMATSRDVIRMQTSLSRLSETTTRLRDDVRDLLHETRELNERLAETRRELAAHEAKRRH